MTHTIPIHLVPAPCLLQMLYKLNNKTLCRLRQTCKKMDEYVEFHRWKIVKRLFEYQISLDQTWYIDIGKENCKITRTCWHARNRVTVFRDPFKELSAIRFCQITVKYRKEMINFRNIGKENVNSTQNFIDFVDLLKKLRLHCNRLSVYLESDQDDVEKVINCIHTCEIHIKHEFSKELSLQELLSCETIQKVNRLQLEINRNAVWSIPEDGLLKYFQAIKSVNFGFKRNSDFGLKFAKFLVKELCASSEYVRLSKVNFNFYDEIDPTTFLESYYPVWRRHHKSSTCMSQTDLFAEERPLNYIILYSSSVTNSALFNNLIPKMQTISIYVCRKKLDRLKNVLRLYAGKVKYFHHIVEMIHNCASK